MPAGQVGAQVDGQVAQKIDDLFLAFRRSRRVFVRQGLAYGTGDACEVPLRRLEQQPPTVPAVLILHRPIPRYARYALANPRRRSAVATVDPRSSPAHFRR